MTLSKRTTRPWAQRSEEPFLEFSPPVAAPPLSRLSEVPLRPSTPPACRHQASPAGRRASLGARCASSTHGCHGTRTRVPLEETSRTQVRPAGSARAAHVVQIRPRGSHGVRLRAPLQGIPLIQVRAAGGAGAAPVVRIRLKGSHEGHVPVPLEGILVIQVRPAGIAGGALSCAGASERGDGSRARASLGGNVKKESVELAVAKCPVANSRAWGDLLATG